MQDDLQHFHGLDDAIRIELKGESMRKEQKDLQKISL